jgi:hypothetical protein
MIQHRLEQGKTTGAVADRHKQMLKASVSRFSSELANVSDTIALTISRTFHFLAKNAPLLCFRWIFRVRRSKSTIFVIRKNGYWYHHDHGYDRQVTTTDYVDYFQQID